MKNKFMAAIGVLLVSISCIASTACVCSAANTTTATLPMAKQTETSASVEEEHSFRSIDAFELRYSRTLSHVTNDVLVLGNGETAKITLVCNPANCTDEDFVFIYNHDVVAPELIDIENDKDNNISKITFTVNKVMPGETDFFVCSGLDYYLASMTGKDLEETLSSIDSPCLHFINLDDEDGQVVYVSDATKTYSADKSKMGKDAEPTTLIEVTALGYKEK